MAAAPPVGRPTAATALAIRVPALIPNNSIANVIRKTKSKHAKQRRSEAANEQSKAKRKAHKQALLEEAIEQRGLDRLEAELENEMRAEIKQPPPPPAGHGLPLEPALDTGKPAVIPRRFGPVITLKIINHVVPFHGSAASEDAVRSLLKGNSLLSLCLHTIFHRGMNTTNGKVMLFPATLVNSQGSWEVYLSMWTLVRSIMVQLYTGFTRSDFVKPVIQAAFGDVMITGLCRDDLFQMTALTGSVAMTHGRVLTEGHFAMSADFVMAAAEILKSYTIETLIYEDNDTPENANIFCTDRRVTIEKLKDYKDNGISASRLFRAPQSKYKDWTAFRALPPSFTESTPAFGLPYWDSLLEHWKDVRESSSKRTGLTLCHLRDMYTSSPGPVQTRAQVFAAHPEGVPDDSVMRPDHAHNKAELRMKEKLKRQLEENGMDPIRPGRPNKLMIEKMKVVKEAKIMIQAQQGFKHHKKRRTIGAQKAPPTKLELSKLIQSIVPVVHPTGLYTMEDMAGVQALAEQI